MSIYLWSGDSKIRGDHRWVWWVGLGLGIEGIILWGGGGDGMVRTVPFGQGFSKDKVLEMGEESVCGNENLKLYTMT